MTTAKPERATETQADYLDALAQRFLDLHATVLSLPSHPACHAEADYLADTAGKALVAAHSIRRGGVTSPPAQIVADYIAAIEDSRGVTARRVATLVERMRDR